VCATLFFLDSLNKKKTAIQSNGVDKVSCTSKPCKWNIPSKRKGAIQPIKLMKFRKHDYSKVNKAEQLTSTVEEANVETESCDKQHWSKDKLQEMYEQLNNVQKKSAHCIGWCHILPQQLPEQSPKAEELVLLSPISIRDSPISLQGIKERIEKVKSKLFVNPEQALEIEKETQEQSVSKSWHFHRQYRITASKCYRFASGVKMGFT